MLAGRVIEAVTGSTYEEALRELVLDPLRLNHSRFFSDEIIGFNVAASHAIVDGEPAVDNSVWHLPRSIHSTEGLISSVRDQLRYAAFHLGDGGRPTAAGCSSRSRWWQCAPTRDPAGPCTSSSTAWG